ncbi:unnamed protein product [Ambrosiozyma monospora]|uniref:Unnamed protein product n=1 Tax=Ambrosiozyma monospora TaxID=43982 RepID=A0ACB5T952_AMBMO|nr:unnamed protein product [Ambrosiozyma monospora]
MNRRKVAPNRTTLNCMVKYATFSNNSDALLNLLLQFKINDGGSFGLQYHLNEYETQLYLNSLVQLNQRDLAKSILTSLVTIRKKYYKLNHNDSMPMTSTVSSFDKLNKTASKCYDIIIKDQKLIQFVPHLNSNMFLPFYKTLTSFDELRQLNQIMTNNRISFTNEIIGSIFEYLHSVKSELDLTGFKYIMADLFLNKNENGNNLGLAYLLFNGKNLELFKDIVWDLMGRGHIDCKSRSILKAFSLLGNAVEHHRYINHMSVENQVALVNAVICLSDFKQSGHQVL